MANEILTKDQLDRFNRWYRYYPKKKSVGEAKKAWKGIDPDEEMTNKIINDLSAQLRYKAEQRKSGDWDDKFWPNPATWLRAEGWEDEIGSHAELKEKRAERNAVSRVVQSLYTLRSTVSSIATTITVMSHQASLETT